MTGRGLLASTIGTDDSVVAAFVSSAHEVSARIFLPATGTWDRLYPWPELASLAGLPLTSDLRWSTVQSTLPPEVTTTVHPAEGQMRTALVARLASILRRGTATPDRFHHAMWEGYVEEQDDDRGHTFPPGTEELHSRYGGLILRDGDGEWLVERSQQLTAHYPVFWWPADGAFVVSNPIYHDSLYVSCSRSLLNEIQRAGVTALEITPEMAVPSEGD